MVLPHSTGDLYHKYRPRKFGEIAGHSEVVTSIRSAMSDPARSQVYLLTGSTGTGKTTTARIMAMSVNCDAPVDGDPCLKCGPCESILTGNCLDVMEINAANTRGIGDMRGLLSSLPMMPMLLNYKIVILDEAHQLTGDAQTSLLKVLEDAPKHVMFILCSTHAKKIIPAVRNRCQRHTFGNLTKTEMMNLLEEVTTMEARDLPRGAYETIVSATGGSPRAALVALQKVLHLDTDDLRKIARVLGEEDEQDANVMKIAFALNGGKTWQSVASAYKEVSHMGPTAIGMVVAGVFRNQLLRATSPHVAKRAAQKLSFFTTLFAEGKLGENQLVDALYAAFEVTSAKR